MTVIEEGKMIVVDDNKESMTGRMRKNRITKMSAY